MFPISSCDIISAAAPEPKIFYVFLHGLITLFINGNPVFNNGLTSLLRNSLDCTILDN